MPAQMPDYAMPDRLLHDQRKRSEEGHSKDHRQAQQPLQSPHESIPLQQPIASRIPATLHGPNGILRTSSPSQPQSFGPSAEQTPTEYQQQPLLNLTNAAAPAVTNGAAVPQGQQPILNDALSYLDQVKVRFQDRPDVYNRFLDIMKDFKSQAIDTPGVIDRVSTLFAGHPELIQGFNTFLPPGYKIECGLNDDPNSIRVTTPMGTTVQQMSHIQGRLAASLNGASEGGRETTYAEAGHNAEWAAQHQQEAEHHDGQYAAGRQAALGLFAGQPHMGPDGMVQYDDIDGQYGDSQLLGLEKRGPVEFNHAIGYVNKIKPEIYKQFLEILQTYQRESRPIQDVYAQVTQLFDSAQDLLEDFKQFLPESAAHAKAQAQAIAAQHGDEMSLLNAMRNQGPYGNGSVPSSTPRADHQKMPPMGTFAPPSASKDNKKRRGAAADVTTGRKVGNTNKRLRVDQARYDQMPISPTLVPSLPAPLPPTKDMGLTNEEFTFFERVKKHLGNRQVFNEFLKVCNLYTQEIIDRSAVVQRVHAFLGGSPDLMAWFKNFVSYSGDDVKLVNEARMPKGKVVLSNCRGLGPSYRLLPNRERTRPCAGRDEICRSVLNDTWVSHPTWASEESGFIAHRKNLYEEALHRIEEERHDYDINVEACMRTIQLLEPIAQQMLQMTDEEKFAFRLPPGIGGQSETIHQRVIKKIYGREKGCAVVKDMFDRPSAVVPVLLGRLRQKAEEWKASQREWEKVWREQTNRVFWRSLDHQGISQKQNDKRQFQPKALHNEIQTIYEEQRQQRALARVDVPRYQFRYDFSDLDVVYDASRLILSQLSNNFVGTEVDKHRLETFLLTFIPVFFDLNRESFAERMKDINEQSRQTNDSDNEVPSLTASPPGEPLLDTAEHQWISMPPTHDIKTSFKREDFHLYATSNIYCFFRMFQLFYERLRSVKCLEHRVKNDITRSRMAKPAIDLGLVDKLPSEFFSDVGDEANYYKQIVNMCEETVRSELEVSVLEETLRRFYMPDGWHLYSLEKMLSALLRFALQILVSDNKDKSLDIVNLFYKDRQEDETTHEKELTYRRQVERLGREDIFRIRYNRPSRTAYVQIFKKDDKTYEADELVATAQWSYYVSAFSMFDRTEGVAAARVPYLRRNMPSFVGESRDEDGDGNAHHYYNLNAASLDEVAHDERLAMPLANHDGLVIRISRHNYHMLYDPGTRDWWVQSTAMREHSRRQAERLSSKRVDRMREMLSSPQWNVWMQQLDPQNAEKQRTAIRKVEQAFSDWMRDGPSAPAPIEGVDAVMNDA